MLHVRVHLFGKKIIFLIINYLEINRSVEVNLRGKLYTANRKYLYPDVNINKITSLGITKLFTLFWF